MNMECPNCETSLRVDGFVRDDGTVEIEVCCPNDVTDRTNCVPELKGYLKLSQEDGGWVLR